MCELSRLKQGLKSNSDSFTHYSVFTGPGEYYCIYKKTKIKYFVAPEEAACNLKIASSDVTHFEKQSTPLTLLDSLWTV